MALVASNDIHEYKNTEISMFSRSLKIHAELLYLSNAVGLHIYERMPDGKVIMASKLEFEEIDPNLVVGTPVLTLPYTIAQELMDNLWQCGLRPTEGTGSAGSLKATENHLKDMQAFAKDLLGMLRADYHSKQNIEIKDTGKPSK